MPKSLREAAAALDKVTHFLAAVARSYAESDPQWKLNTYDPYFVEVIVPMFANLRAALDAPDGWISVEERLPERLRWSIVTLDDGRVRIGYIGPKFSTYGLDHGDAWGTGNNWSDWFHPHKVTHWQPLPEPPQSREEAE